MNDPEHAVRLFATDIDDTLLGDADAAQQFHQAWNAIDPERRPLLVYNSGRSVRDVQWLVLEQRIPAAEFIIGGIGTEVHDPVDAGVEAEFRMAIAEGWDGAKVDEIVRTVPAARLQPEEFLNGCKRSWHWPRASVVERAALEGRLRAAGLDATVQYSSEIFLDVIPRGAGKGNALAWLCRRIGIRPGDVLVAGAGANNISMFALPGVRGIVVGNAASELFAATLAFNPLITREKTAHGVLAGLEHFGVLLEVVPERR